jgi:hypothetical protein
MAAAPGHDLERENFDLRMRVYHMEQRMNEVLAATGPVSHGRAAAASSAGGGGGGMGYGHPHDAHYHASTAMTATDFTPGIPPLLHRDALLLRAKDAISKLEVRGCGWRRAGGGRCTRQRPSSGHGAKGSALPRL